MQLHYALQYTSDLASTVRCSVSLVHVPRVTLSNVYTISSPSLPSHLPSHLRDLPEASRVTLEVFIYAHFTLKSKLTIFSSLSHLSQLSSLPHSIFLLSFSPLPTGCEPSHAFDVCLLARDYTSFNIRHLLLEFPALLQPVCEITFAFVLRHLYC